MLDVYIYIYVNKRYIFVTENYEIFSTKVSAREKQGQDKGGPHQRVIRSFVISSVGQPF